MKSLHIYDPALCCSSGVCGPEVDPTLVHFAADLKWLEAQGVSVTRHNLAQNPAAFVANESVKTALSTAGESALPLLFADDGVIASGSYPARAELAAAVGLVTGDTATTATGCGGGDDDASTATTGCGGGDASEPKAAGERCGG